MLKHIILFLSLFFQIMTAQAATKTVIKQYGQPVPDKALVYLLRDKHFNLSLRTQFVYSDQDFLGSLDNGTYTFAYVEPGSHLIWSNWTSVQKKIDFVAGQTYYLDIFTEVSLLSAQDGQGRIQRLGNYVTPTDGEKKVAARHIANRFDRAVKKMYKDEYAEIPRVETSQTFVQKPGSIKLPANSQIRVKLLENITSQYTKVGESVIFQVISDVVQNGKVLIARETLVSGVVAHISDGGMAHGYAGSLDVKIPSVPAVDGNLIPVVGDIARRAGDRSDEAALRQMAFGMIGVLSMRTNQSSLFSQEDFSIVTQTDVWITPQTRSLAPTVAGAGSTHAGLTPYSAAIAKTLKFRPDKKQSLPDIQIELPRQYQWEGLALTAVNGLSLPKPVAAKQKVANTAMQNFVFDAWNIVRYLPLESGLREYQLTFSGKSGAYQFPILAKMVLDMKVR